jgi:hypothetical protein
VRAANPRLIPTLDDDDDEGDDDDSSDSDVKVSEGEESEESDAMGAAVELFGIPGTIDARKRRVLTPRARRTRAARVARRAQRSTSRSQCTIFDKSHADDDDERI